MIRSALLAASPFGIEGVAMYLLIAVVLVAMVFISFLLLISSQYKHCPSNKVLVIYGRTKRGTAARTIHGGAAFVVPLLQDYAYLSLEPHQIEIPLRSALLVGKHPRQCPQRVHGSHWHRARCNEPGLHPPAGPLRSRDPQTLRRNHLQPAAQGDFLKCASTTSIATGRRSSTISNNRSSRNSPRSACS